MNSTLKRKLIAAGFVLVTGLPIVGRDGEIRTLRQLPESFQASWGQDGDFFMLVTDDGRLWITNHSNHSPDRKFRNLIYQEFRDYNYIYLTEPEKERIAKDYLPHPDRGERFRLAELLNRIRDPECEFQPESVVS